MTRSSAEKYTYHVTIVSWKSPYVVKYEINVSGKPAKTGGSPQMLAQGQYRGWTWAIRAAPPEAVALTQWLHSVQPTAQTDTFGGVRSSLDWNSMMPRLYDLDAYLLGQPPPPANIQVLLLSRVGYRFVGTLHSADALPLKLVIRDRGSTADPTKLDSEQSSVVFTMQTMLQSFIVDAMWKSGVIPKPTKSAYPKEKHIATQLCWLNAANNATIAGSDRNWGKDLKGFAAKPQSGFMKWIDVTAAKEALSGSPDLNTRTESAGIFVGVGLQDYMQTLGFGGTYPETGTDLKWINASINFCRAYTHYTGNIASHPVPPDVDSTTTFFPIHDTSPSARTLP
ncbi:MAG: hypothetical protein ACRETQ_12230 [Gammaproteobacteria bacterium]